MSATPILAAIQAIKDLPVDRLMADIAIRAGQAGLRVAGFLQHRATDADECCSDIEIRHITSGAIRLISQPLGSGSQGCRLDPQALAGVAGELRAELDEGVDLLIINRFGKGETEGQGLRAIIEAAYALGVPVLTVVRDTYVEGWHDFAGECGTLLEPQSAAVVQWFEAVTSARSLRLSA